jgi:hypothetical protein
LEKVASFQSYNPAVDSSTSSWLSQQHRINPPTTSSNMRPTTTISTLAFAINLANATVYLAGDSTMALNGANDGVTDGTHHPHPIPNHPTNPN